MLMRWPDVAATVTLSGQADHAIGHNAAPNRSQSQPSMPGSGVGDRRYVGAGGWYVPVVDTRHERYALMAHYYRSYCVTFNRYGESAVIGDGGDIRCHC